MGWVVCALIAAGPGTAHAQLRRKDPRDTPGPYAIDARGVLLGVPAKAAFYPPAPGGTRVPKRSLGFDLGAHVYRGRLGPARLGFGVDVLSTRGKTTTPGAFLTATPTSPSSSTSTSAATTGDVEVTTHFTGVAPQISFNFGGRYGWSYLSGGYGVSTFSSEVTQDRAGAVAGRVTTTNDGTRAGTVNFGAGARWFTSDHLAFSFDARFHKVAASGVRPATQLFGMSAGVSLR